MERKIKVLLDKEIAEYATRNPKSRQMFARAKESLPGGNTRTGVYIDPFPLYADYGEGTYLYDLDGHRLLDFVNNNTALPLGHAHPDIVAALQEQVTRGTGFSRPLPLEVEMAELLRERMPALEKLRFCSSGTEAVLNALRVARAFTGRAKVAKFEGAYHGIDDSALVSYLPPLGPELGPEGKPQGVASSAGLMAHTLAETIILPFNDAEACAAIIEAHGPELAAVIVDPLSTAAGLTLPEDEFLTRLRQLTDRVGALLIFDEIVSFRFGPSGTHGAYRVRPDLICLGKVIAGGTPGAVFGGRADAMQLYDPASGPQIQQSGTFNANPIAMVAGLKTLEALTEGAYRQMGALAERAAAGLRAAFSAAGVTVQVVVAGSIFRIYFLDRAPCNFREAARDNGQLHRWLFFALLNRGVYTRMGGNVSLVTGEEHVEELVQTVRDTLKVLAAA
jgi:glutamate-1-semialdehyde 2,1-aminomutase